MTIPDAIGMTLLGLGATGGAAAFGLAWRWSGSLVKIEAGLERLLKRDEKYDPAVVDVTLRDHGRRIDNLEAGHERNRQRIEETYEDLSGSRRETSRPG